MYKRTIGFLFQALAVRQYLIFSGTFFILTAFVMLILDAQLRPSGCMISLELAFTKSAFNQILDKCGADGIRSHLIMIWVDYLFIIAYTGFLANLLGSLLKGRGIDYERALTFFSFTIIAGVLDLIENTFLLIQLPNSESLSGVLIFLASSAAAIKFILIGITITLILYYLVTMKSRLVPKN